MESVIEENKDLYYKALRRTQSTLKSDTPDLEPWIGFFLRCLKKQKDILAARVEDEKRASSETGELSLLSEQILALFADHDRLTLPKITKLTGANRNTIKVRVRELVESAHIKQHGKARATWYSLR